MDLDLKKNTQTIKFPSFIKFIANLTLQYNNGIFSVKKFWKEIIIVPTKRTIKTEIPFIKRKKTPLDTFLMRKFLNGKGIKIMRDNFLDRDFISHVDDDDCLVNKFVSYFFFLYLNKSFHFFVRNIDFYKQSIIGKFSRLFNCDFYCMTHVCVTQKKRSIVKNSTQHVTQLFKRLV